MAIPVLPGVKFGNYHSYNTWNCYLSEKEIGFPEARTHLISVPGRDGYIDLTETLRGRPIFDNRKLKIKLWYKSKYDTWDAKLMEISTAIHGRRMKIVFDDDQNYAFFGRCHVSHEKINKWECYIIIDVDADPYKQGVNAKHSRNLSIASNVYGTGYSITEEVGWQFHVKLVVTSELTQTIQGFIAISAEGYKYKKIPFVISPEHMTEEFNGVLCYCGTNRNASLTVNVSGTHQAFNCTLSVTEARI